MSSFTDRLAVEGIPGTDFWVQLRDLIFYAGEEGSDEAYLIPKGFVTDGGSIPAFVQPLLGPPMHPDTAAEYDLHDWCYRTQGLTMAELLSDEDFRDHIALLEGALTNDAHNWTGPDGQLSRQRCDAILREALTECSNLWGWRIWCVYWGLRIGGWYAWNKYRRDQKRELNNVNVHGGRDARITSG